MIRTFAAIVLSMAVATPAYAGFLVAPVETHVSSMLTQVAQGCGGGRYRGPYGSCHRFGTGPYPGGFYGRPGHYCWRGPHGARHCR
jgi:hypothetical protein